MATLLAKTSWELILTIIFERVADFDFVLLIQMDLSILICIRCN